MKIVYLDLEQSEEQRNGKWQNFFYPHLPDNQSKRKKCMENFIVGGKELLMENDDDSFDCDLTKAANHQRVFDLLERAKDMGSKGSLPDVLVIDTYSKIVGNQEDISSWGKVAPLLEKIAAMGIAVVILDHANSKGELGGYAGKKKTATSMIKLGRKNNEAGTLEKPVTVEMDKLRESIIGGDFDAFDIQFKDKKWQVSKPQKSFEKEFCEIADGYQKAGFEGDAIAEMLGYKSSRYYELLKDYRKKSK
jgi:hypothetical protein